MTRRLEYFYGTLRMLNCKTVACWPLDNTINSWHANTSFYFFYSFAYVWDKRYSKPVKIGYSAVSVLGAVLVMSSPFAPKIEAKATKVFIRHTCLRSHTSWVLCTLSNIEGSSSFHTTGLGKCLTLSQSLPIKYLHCHRILHYHANPSMLPKLQATAPWT